MRANTLHILKIGYDEEQDMGIVAKRYLDMGFKHFNGEWYYKIYETVDYLQRPNIVRKVFDHCEIMHLCRKIGFVNNDKCTSCGEDIPFALKIHRMKYA